VTLLAYRFALDPTPAQERSLRSHTGAARMAFNWGLARVIANLGQREAEKSYGMAGDDLTPPMPWSLYSLRNGKLVAVGGYFRPDRNRTANAGSTPHPPSPVTPPLAPKPRRRRTGRSKRLVITVTVTAALGTAGGITATVSNASSGATTGQSAAVAPNANVSLEDFKNVRSTLLTTGYKHIDFAEEYDSSCEQHSYGQVEEFFKSHPCNWVVRAYLAVHDNSLGEVLVALSWVGMPNASSAAAYKSLVDIGGTGNITELSRDTDPYRAIKYDGQFYASGLDASSVWNIQVQPVGAIPTAFTTRILDEFK